MNWPTDTLTGIYLGLFAFGGIFSVISLLLGAVGGHFHVPGAVHAGHAPHFGHHGHGDPNIGQTDAAVHDVAAPLGPGAAPGPLNLSTVMIFLTWFGATGYLLRLYTSEAAALSLLIALGVGLVGALIVWLVLAKILWRGQSQLDPRNYAIMGVTARVTAPIGAGGTGEIVYTLDGKRQVDAARASDDTPLPRGAEVAIIRRSGGIAYVVSLDDAAGGDPFEELEARTGARTAVQEETR